MIHSDPTGVGSPSARVGVEEGVIREAAVPRHIQNSAAGEILKILTPFTRLIVVSFEIRRRRRRFFCLYTLQTLIITGSQRFILYFDEILRRLRGKSARETLLHPWWLSIFNTQEARYFQKVRARLRRARDQLGKGGMDNVSNGIPFICWPTPTLWGSDSRKSRVGLNWKFSRAPTLWGSGF